MVGTALNFILQLGPSPDSFVNFRANKFLKALSFNTFFIVFSLLMTILYLVLLEVLTLK